jgi:hypothetical protein
MTTDGTSANASAPAHCTPLKSAVPSKPWNKGHSIANQVTKAGIPIHLKNGKYGPYQPGVTRPALPLSGDWERQNLIIGG